MTVLVQSSIEKSILLALSLLYIYINDKIFKKLLFHFLKYLTFPDISGHSANIYILLIKLRVTFRTAGITIKIYCVHDEFQFHIEVVRVRFWFQYFWKLYRHFYKDKLNIWSISSWTPLIHTNAPERSGWN